MILRGSREVVEVVLKDQHGIRASKHCSDPTEIENVLDSWRSNYACDVTRLFDMAMRSAPLDTFFLLQAWMPRTTRQPRFMSPEAALNLLNLAGDSYRPQEILDLNEAIEAEKRAALFAASAKGVFDPDRINKIVRMMREKDGLYGDWGEGILR